MEKLISRDGIQIAYSRSGTGPPLVLLHGTAEDQTRWIPILRLLAQHFTVYAIDRRGRNESGDRERYSLQEEADDVLGILDALNEPTHILSHSYGALCLMEAAVCADRLGKLIFYEPPVPQDGNFYPPGSIEGLEALLQQGDRTGVITTFLRDFLHLSPMELELVSYLPVWPARVAAAHTIPRELRQIQAYRLQAERFSAVKAPSLLVLGGDSPPKMSASIEALQGALPNSQVVVIPGQQHNAISMAPHVFARDVLRFLTED